MLKNCWIPALAAWQILLTAVAADISPRPAAHYSIKTWDSEDGLPQKTVIAMTQTRDGYLWAGTLAGLARFDGVRFTTFNEGNTPEFTSDEIIRLFEDSHGNLWIGTRTAGIYVVMAGKVKRVKIGPGERLGRLMSICEDSQGAIWLYTDQGELCQYLNGVVTATGPSNDQAQYRAVIVEGDYLWVGSDRSLAAIGPLPSGRVAGFPLAHEMRVGKLDFLLASRSGGFWRLADKRIQKWKGSQLERDLGGYPWSPGVLVTAACEDRDGQLVVGTDGDGVFWFDAEGHFSRLTTELPTTQILSLVADKEGSLWIGTNGRGLVRARPQVFEVFEPSRGITVNSVFEDGQGGVWVGYQAQRVDHLSNGKLEVLTDLQGSSISANFAPKLYVRAVFVDHQGQVWAGTDATGLLQKRGGRFLPAPGFANLPSGISLIFEDRTNRLWVGGLLGLAHWQGDGWKQNRIRDASAPEDVRAMAEDREGNLWVGTQGGGLSRLRNGQWTSFGQTNGLPSDNVLSLYVDQADVLWAGTGRGLARLRNGVCFSYAGRLDFPSAKIGYLLEDALGYLWLGSSTGLTRVRKQDLNEVAAEKRKSLVIRSYGKADGLPNSECTQSSLGQPAACRTRDGILWFPTIGGLVTVNPSLLTRNTNPPPVVIEAVKLGGQMLSTNSLGAPPPRAVTVPAGKAGLEIAFTSLNLAAPDKGLFRYQLVNHEPGWTEVDANTRFARYPKLPPGDYQFQVTACNEDGVWNPAAASLAVTVQPAFWQTRSFTAVVALCLLGMIVGSVYYVSTQKLQRQLAVLRQQEALEKERGRIARDLHDQLGANLTQVALLGEMAEADKDLPEEVEAHARQISETARTTTHALDEIVWTVNPSNDTLDGLINYVCKYAQDYFALAELRYRLDVPPQLPHTPITPELRHNIFLAAKEAVNNVVKHAHASSAWLRLQLGDGEFVLEIEDDGRGIAVGDDAKGRNGLRNMRKRMEDVGGKFETGPGAEGGTRIRLTVPVNARQGNGNPGKG
jgi:ligand-binding sensor domain-containing protein/signal transduction histidine kinase